MALSFFQVGERTCLSRGGVLLPRYLEFRVDNRNRGDSICRHSLLFFLTSLAREICLHILLSGLRAFGSTSSEIGLVSEGFVTFSEVLGR